MMIRYDQVKVDKGQMRVKLWLDEGQMRVKSWLDEGQVRFFDDKTKLR